MRTSHYGSTRKLWLHWVLASTLGWAGGAGLLLLLQGSGGWPETVAGSLAFGLVVGLAQWVVLRWQIPRAGWWVVSTTLAVAAGALLTWGVLRVAVVASFLIRLPLDSPAVLTALIGAAAGAAFGAVAGYGQTWGLPAYVRQGSPWTLATAAGAVLDGVALGLLLHLFAGGTVLVGALGALFGPFKGIVSGLALAHYDLQ